MINVLHGIDMIRALGTGEALFNMSSGKLEASLDRVEGILTHYDKGTLTHNDADDLFDYKEKV